MNFLIIYPRNLPVNIFRHHRSAISHRQSPIQHIIVQKNLANPHKVCYSIFVMNKTAKGVDEDSKPVRSCAQRAGDGASPEAADRAENPFTSRVPERLSSRVRRRPSVTGAAYPCMLGWF